MYTMGRPIVGSDIQHVSDNQNLVADFFLCVCVCDVACYLQSDY